MPMWFTIMKEHRKHLESAVFQYSVSAGHICAWVIVLCPDQRFQTKHSTPFFSPPSFPFTRKSNFHIIYLNIKGKDINHDVSLHFFSLLISLLHGHTIIIGNEFPDRCLSNFDVFVYITFNRSDKITTLTNI
jgi:hypothetical protein